MTNRNLILGNLLGLAAIALILWLALQPGCGPNYPNKVIQITRDTVIRHDTVYARVPEPTKVTVIRYDTIRRILKPVDESKVFADGTKINSIRDTTQARTPHSDEIIIPIESKEYKTDNYRAIVSGYKCNLDTMTLYSKVTTITEHITKLKSPRWSIVAGVGVGYNKEVLPYIGVTFGYVIWSK